MLLGLENKGKIVVAVEQGERTNMKNRMQYKNSNNKNWELGQEMTHQTHACGVGQKVMHDIFFS